MPASHASRSFGQGRSPINALTFDIEDWFHLLDRSRFNDAAQWPTLPSLVERYTDLILHTLSEARVRATFFCVGWVAQRYPRLVRDIAAADHEVACHSYWHRRVDELGRERFRDDLRRAIDVIAGQLGRPVIGYRAPGFSVTASTPWVFEELLDAGIAYDASVVPARSGGARSQRGPHERWVPSRRRAIRLLPMNVCRLGPWQVRYTGAGYLRLLPTEVLLGLMRRENNAGRPNVVYLHPRDFAVDCPRAPLSMWKAFRTYHGLHTTAPKLQRLLHTFDFTTAADVAGVAAATAQAPERIALATVPDEPALATAPA